MTIAEIDLIRQLIRLEVEKILDEAGGAYTDLNSQIFNVRDELASLETSSESKSLLSTNEKRLFHVLLEDSPKHEYALIKN